MPVTMTRPGRRRISAHRLREGRAEAVPQRGGKGVEPVAFGLQRAQGGGHRVARGLVGGVARRGRRFEGLERLGHEPP